MRNMDPAPARARARHESRAVLSRAVLPRRSWIAIPALREHVAAHEVVKTPIGEHAQRQLAHGG
jgi:hypothetical protein